LEPYKLDLRSAFGTSHSLTTQRTNALITAQINDNFVGYGEIGLPPKKPLCYTADYEDVETYFKSYQKEMERLPIEQVILDFDPFADLPQKYFQDVRNPSDCKDENQKNCIKFIYQALKVLDNCPINIEEMSRPPRSGIENALLDLLGKIIHKPLFEIIGAKLESRNVLPSFFTASLNPDIEQIVSTSKDGRKFTPFLKIKLDSDVKKGLNILKRLFIEFQSFSPIKQWSLDANSAWNPEITLEYLSLIEKEEFKEYIYMLEQPFPVEFGKTKEISKEDSLKWMEVKNACEKLGIYIYADESISTYEDIPKLASYVHGINVKLEKASGIRGALRAIDEAKKSNLKVWIGQMVSSCLNSSTASQLVPFADYGCDLDGSLLVDDASSKFTGGFEWGNTGSKFGYVTFPEGMIGVGVHLKHQ